MKKRKKTSASSLNLRKSLPTLSVCMIVKNEEKHLHHSLSSVKPIADEIVVVDTGSTDRSKEIAISFGAAVHHFAWVEDFSRARNFAIFKARGEWIFILDADEAISAKDHQRLRDILAISKEKLVGYRIQTRNYTNRANIFGFRANRYDFPEENGLGWYPSDKVRLFPNTPSIRFEYPVHEIVEPSLARYKIPIRECPVTVHHFGTLDDTHTFKKTNIYHELGQKKEKEYPKEPAALKELAIQSAQLGNHAEALDVWSRFIESRPESAEAFLNMGAACWSLGRYPEAVTFSEKALRLDPSLREAKFNLAYSLLLMGRAEDSRRALEAILELHSDYLPAQFVLCVAYACIGETRAAEGIFRKLRALPVGMYIGESFLDGAKRFLSASCRKYARDTLEVAVHFGCANREIQNLLENLRTAL